MVSHRTRRHPDRHRHSRGARTALRTGHIAACLLSPPRQLVLYREGFNKLAYSGDYLTSYPSGGIGATEEKIRTNPSEVLAFVRASLKGLQYYTQNRAESVDNISKYLGIKDPSLAGEAGGLRPPCKPAWWNRLWRKPGCAAPLILPRRAWGVTKEVPPGQVFDFSFCRKSHGANQKLIRIVKAEARDM